MGALYMIFLAVHILLSKPVEEGQARNVLNTFKAGIFYAVHSMLKLLFMGSQSSRLFMMDIMDDPLSIGIAALAAWYGWIYSRIHLGNRRKYFQEIAQRNTTYYSILLWVDY